MSDETPKPQAPPTRPAPGPAAVDAHIQDGISVNEMPSAADIERSADLDTARTKQGFHEYDNPAGAIIVRELQEIKEVLSHMAPTVTAINYMMGILAVAVLYHVAKNVKFQTIPEVPS